MFNIITFNTNKITLDFEQDVGILFTCFCFYYLFCIGFKK